jgi:transposase
MRSLDASKLIFIDESGCHPGIGPRRGWAPRGEPLFGPEQSYARGKHVSIVGAIGTDGPVAKATCRGGVGSKQFLGFIKKRLVPKLKPGQIVCMDNLAAHKSKTIRKLIEGAGCSVLFLPPYSPDLNPIEAAWAKLKHLIRKICPDTIEELRAAIYAAWRKISSNDIKGWFKYCGYKLS